MADCAFNTRFRRRAILAGGTAAIAAPALGLSAGPSTGAAAKPGFLPDGDSNPGPNPDAGLLRRLAVAERRWAEYEAARPAFRQAFVAMVGHPDYPDMARIECITPTIRARWAELAEVTGYSEAAERRETAHALYITASVAAFDTPTLTLRGLCAKMDFAVTVAVECLEPCESDWLRRTLADLERLAAGHV